MERFSSSKFFLLTLTLQQNFLPTESVGLKTKGWGGFRKAISSFRYHHTMLVANFQGSPTQTTIYASVLMLNPGNWPHCSARNRYRLPKTTPALQDILTAFAHPGLSFAVVLSRLKKGSEDTRCPPGNRPLDPPGSFQTAQIP
jgi:hypothetical protein